MPHTTPTRALAASSLLFLSALVCAPLSAQTPSADKSANKASSSAEVAPAASQLSLMQVIQKALRQSTQLALQRSQVALQMGVLQSAEGAFDPILTQDTNLSFVQEELSDQAQAAQVRTRTENQELIDDFNQRLRDEQAVRQELGLVRADPTGTMITNPDLRAQIGLLNRLIQAQTDPAIRNELIAQRDSGIDEEIASSDADIASLTTDRDKEVERLRKLGPAPTVDTRYDASIAAGWRKSYRNGWTLNASALLTMAGTDFAGKRRAPEFGGKGVLDLYRTKIGLDVLAPLGRGRTQLAATERASRLDLNVAQALLAQQVAAVVRDSANAYWQLVAAAQRLQIARDSLQRQQQIGELTAALVRADQTPRSEIARAAASAAEAQARVIQSESALITARFALAQVIGQKVQTLDDAPWPADGFPPLTELAKLDTVNLLELEQRSLRRRSDFSAAVLQSDSAEVLALAAQAEIAPKRDLSAGIFATGVAEDSAVGTALKDAITGKYTLPSISLGYSYERPWRNDAALGQLAQQQAFLQQRNILRDDLARRLRSGIALSLERLQRAQAQVKVLQEATTLYLESVTSERERLRTGSSTLIDLLLTEERATNVLFSMIGAEASYAAALVDLRFATGILLSQDQQQVLLDEHALVTITVDELMAW
jgi:outer membrane protein TolC